MCKWSLVIICGSLLTVVIGDPGFHNSVGMKTFRRDVLSNSKHILRRPLQMKDTKFDVEIIKLDVIELPYKGSRDSLKLHHNYGRLPPPTRPPASYHQEPSYHQLPPYHQAPPYHQGSSHYYRRSPHHYVTHKEKQTYRQDEEPSYSKYISGRTLQTQNRNIDIEIIKLDVIELPYKHPQTSPQYDPQIVRHFYYAQFPSQPLSPPPYHEGHSHHYRGSPYHYEVKPISSDHKDQYIHHGPETAFYDKQHPPLSHSKVPPPLLNHRTSVLPPHHQSLSKTSNSNKNQPKTMYSMLEENSNSVTTTPEQEFMIDIRSGDE